MEVFIATGNKDKFNRMHAWLPEGVTATAPFMLDQKLADATKITDTEEKQYSTMQERAVAKAEKAAGVLADKVDYVLAMDDTCYLPWVDMYVIDLRYPEAVMHNGKQIMPAVTDRLSGISLANHYARMTDLVATDELIQEELSAQGVTGWPKDKIMPIEWRFALAAATSKAAGKVIAEWSWRQYLHNTYLTETKDTGYVIGKISSDSLLESAGVHTMTIPTETIPKDAIIDLLK